jgi:hypothetical protein
MIAIIEQTKQHRRLPSVVLLQFIEPGHRASPINIGSGMLGSGRLGSYLLDAAVALCPRRFPAGPLMRSSNSIEVIRSRL